MSIKHKDCKYKKELYKFQIATNLTLFIQNTSGLVTFFKKATLTKCIQSYYVYLKNIFKMSF